MKRRSLDAALIAVATAVAAGAGSMAPATANAQQIPVQAGVTVAPDTVRIGDPFRIVIGIRAPRGATVDFPNPPDSTSPIQALDPVAIATKPDSSAVVQYATYRVAAWDVDSQRVRFDDVIVTLNGATRHVPIAAQLVFVKTVLPADSAQRVPKPPRALFVNTAWPWWLWALIAAAAALIVGLLIWWWRRKHRRPALVVSVSPYERAQKEFARIEALGLLQAGERGRYVALMVEVLREYLSGRYAAAPLSLTSGELVAALRGLPHVGVDKLARLLADADLVKFARRAVSAERAAEFGRDARLLVEHEHESSQAAEAAARAAEAAAAHGKAAA